MQLAGKNLANPAQLVFTSPCTSLTFKNLAGKILAGLDKSAKIFHHQNFALYGIITQNICDAESEGKQGIG